MADFIQYSPVTFTEQEQLLRAREFFDLCSRRRTVRDYLDRPVHRELIELLLCTAGTAPSGANKQPWRFVVVTDPNLKREIRLAAEKEERENYERRMPQEWLDDLAALGTDWHKEFLEIAPRSRTSRTDGRTTTFRNQWELRAAFSLRRFTTQDL